MQLDNKQTKAISLVDTWAKECVVELTAEKEKLTKPIFYLAGYAGVGKTTIAKHFRENITGRVCYASFTGKAALMMQRNGCYGAQTLHSLIYSIDDTVKEGEDEEGKKATQPKFVLNSSSELRFAKLLIVDECSMVNNEMGSDLLSFNRPILVLGDPGQLPPVHGTGFFTERTPDILLTEVHRQALGNPIIRVATDIRNGKPLARFSEGDCLIYPKSDELSIEEVVETYTQMITGKNATRHTMNAYARKHFRASGNMPQKNDRIICLRNNRQEGLLNGLIGTVDKCSHDDERIILDFHSEEGKNYRGIQVHTLCFTDPDVLKELPYRDRAEFNEFDYGYCITCHKSQGSQWESVALLDDGMFTWDRVNRMRWLYTGVTRAQEKLAVLRPRL